LCPCASLSLQKLCPKKKRSFPEKRRCPSFLCLQLMTYTLKMKTTLGKWYLHDDNDEDNDDEELTMMIVSVLMIHKSFLSFPSPNFENKAAFDHRHYLCNSIHFPTRRREDVRGRCSLSNVMTPHKHKTQKENLSLLRLFITNTDTFITKTCKWSRENNFVGKHWTTVNYLGQEKNTR